MLGIGLPVGRHVEAAAYFELFTEGLSNFGLHHAALVVFLFVPGVGKEQLNRIQRVIGDAVVEYQQRIFVVDPEVVQLGIGGVAEQAARCCPGGMRPARTTKVRMERNRLFSSGLCFSALVSDASCSGVFSSVMVVMDSF